MSRPARRARRRIPKPRADNAVALAVGPCPGGRSHRRNREDRRRRTIWRSGRYHRPRAVAGAVGMGSTVTVDRTGGA
jgi:hypothetical protein